ncbi:hypothetical protein CR513_03242, partial [Mucuna pruriens]
MGSNQTHSAQVVVVGKVGDLFLKSLIILYDQIHSPRSPLIIQVLAKLAYLDNHAVPWLYNSTKVTPKEKDSTKEVTNIVEPGGVTRSGRIYTPDTLRKKIPSSEAKGVAVENTKVPTIGKEAEEFLKLIRHSEYELLDQMNKTLALISLLSLLINSESHRNLLFKTMNEAHVAQDIMVEKFGGIVNNLTIGSHLSFSKEEILAEGRGHNQPLHIFVKCGDYTIARLLIDNGSSLNVLPKNHAGQIMLH